VGGIQSQPHAAKALFAQRALTQESALRAELSWLANMVNAKLSFMLTRFSSRDGEGNDGLKKCQPESFSPQSGLRQSD
jgi:hypothetical protein